MDVLPEPSRVFNPSVLQRDVLGDEDHDQEREDAEEERAIAEGIDQQLREMDEDDDLGLNEEDDSLSEDLHAVPNQPNLALQYKEKVFSGDQATSGSEALQILYDARGHQIAKLQTEMSQLDAKYGEESRGLRHQVALLKGESETLRARNEHLTDVANGQVDENRQLRDQVEQLSRKLESVVKGKQDLKGELESSHLMVKTLQSQVIEFQKSESMFKAKQQHNELVTSLRERHELDVLKFQQEMERQQLKIKSKENEVDILRGQLTKIQREHDQHLVEKSHVIRTLQDRLDASQKRLTESQGYNNVKAMNQRYQQDQEQYANDVVAFSDEIKALEKKVQKKEEEACEAQRKLGEMTEKYQSLKRKARQYQNHCKTKEERYLNQLKTNEDEYRAKLLGLKTKMEEAYVSKEKQIETELLGMKLKFNEELTKALRLDAENVFPTDDFLISEASEAKLPPSVERRPLSNASNNATSVDLHKMFEHAKTSVRHELKRPNEQ